MERSFKLVSLEHLFETTYCYVIRITNWRSNVSQSENTFPIKMKKNEKK